MRFVVNNNEKEQTTINYRTDYRNGIQIPYVHCLLLMYLYSNAKLHLKVDLQLFPEPKQCKYN